MIIRATLWILFLALAFAAERPVPPPGVTVAEADRQILQSGVRRLGADIENLKRQQGLRSPLVADVVNLDARDARTATIVTRDGRRFSTADGGATWVSP